MDSELFLLYIAFTLVVGLAIGYFLRLIISIGKKDSMEFEVKQILLDAREEAKNLVADAQKKTDEARAKLESDEEKLSEKKNKTEERLVKKEELLDRRQTALDTDEEELRSRIRTARKRAEEAQALLEKRMHELESISHVSADEAKELLVKEIERTHEEDILHRIKKLDISGEERLQARAREILTSTVHRLGNALPPDVVSTTVLIDSDDVKGKIIGKEGRNIRAFEQKSGVELVIDDTPGAILISSFDPVRREVARRALENLISDGRIQPSRIESEIERAEETVVQNIKEKGEEAVYECGIYTLDPKLVSILGRLYFRTSYGQNVLAHSVEVAKLAGMIAEEVGADVAVAKTAGLLHDVGKAMDADQEGSHVEIGKRILEKFGAREEVIKAMQAHHEEYPYESVEAKIVQVADSISAARPGARRDNVEGFLSRLTDLEDIAEGFDGVERAFAVSAGREIRVFINPESVSDIEARDLARDLARRIEQELSYPGEVKVVVIRESRAIEHAR